jgi:hypothetical protein
MILMLSLFILSPLHALLLLHHECLSVRHLSATTRPLLIGFFFEVGVVILLQFKKSYLSRLRLSIILENFLLCFTCEEFISVWLHSCTRAKFTHWLKLFFLGCTLRTFWFSLLFHGRRHQGLITNVSFFFFETTIVSNWLCSRRPFLFVRHNM